MRRRRLTEEELEAMGSDPRPGEVWWCEGRQLGMDDGAKTRPVLVLSVSPAGTVRVIPLTSRKAEGNPIAVSHRGGLSWFAGEVRTVERLVLLSSLGPWAGFSAWERRHR